MQNQYEEGINLTEKPLMKEHVIHSSHETFSSYSFPSSFSEDFSNFELYPLPPPPSLEKFYSTNLNEAELLRIPCEEDRN